MCHENEKYHRNRFSDKELREFYDEFIDFTSKSSAKDEELIHELKKQKERLNMLQSSIDEVHSSIHGLLQAWQAATGTAKVMSAAARGIKVVGTIIAFFAALWFFIKTGSWK